MKHKLTADRLNEALNEANMTAQELSKKSGVNKASISQYRNGTHKPSFIKRIIKSITITNESKNNPDIIFMG